MNTRTATAATLIFACCVQPALSALGALPSDPDSIQLARDGRSEYRVVIAANAEEPIPAAAQDFVQTFAQITGAELAIVTDAEPMGEHEIIIGPSAHLDNLAVCIDWDRLGREGYVIRTVGEHLLLFGGPPRGTINAVYAFLEGHLGCRWYTPDFSVIPRQDDLSIGLIHDETIPAFEARSLYAAVSVDAAWAARNHINCFNASLRYACPSGFNFGDLQPKLAHPLLAGTLKFGTSRQYGKPSYWNHTLGRDSLLPAKHFDERPELFGVDEKGERNAAITPCLTNPDVLPIVVENAKKRLAQTPGANVISISQSDLPSKDYCHCDRCKEEWKKSSYAPHSNPRGRHDFADMSDWNWVDPNLIRPAFSPVEYPYVGPTGPLLRFVNSAAELLEDEYPDTLVHTFAYYWSKYPPDGVKLHPNVVVDFAPLNACIYHSLADCPYNEGYKGLWTALRRWRKLTRHLWVWHYDWHSPKEAFVPRPTLRYLDLYFSGLRQAGVTGVYVTVDEFRKWRWMTELRSYLYARLMWDPDCGTRETISEFIRACYGPAAAEVLTFVLDTQERANYGDMVDAGRKRFVGFHLGGGEHSDVRPEAVRRWNELLAAAESKVTDAPDFLERVRLARLSAQYCALKYLNRDDPVRVRAQDDFFGASAALGMDESQIKSFRDRFKDAE